jgi:hypothetical protein
MDLLFQRAQAMTRRHFLRKCHVGLGAMALGELMRREGFAAAGAAPLAPNEARPMVPRPPHFAGKAKSVIYLHMSGSPPQHDLFDWKPKLVEYNMKPCPDEYLKGQRFAFIKGTPKLLGTPYKFKRHGQSGQLISEILPTIAAQADDISVIRSMWTDQFNHAPAELFIHTGNARIGGAAIGAWATYGLGSPNQNLPGFVVLLSGGTDPTAGKSVWGSGYLPSVFQGVQCRSEKDPILYVNDPKGMARDDRRRSLDALKKLNEFELQQIGDPETMTRIAQYELAYRMQVSVPEVMDIAREPKAIQEMYGAQPGAGSFANNCLQARRLVEQGVRYVQLFDWGWDCHGTGEGDDIVKHLPNKCREIDKPIGALIRDLKQRGLLEQTLIVWGGEFGRTPMNEERGGSKALGRDHHPHAFSIFMAGGGIKPGLSFGETDELGYFITKDKMSVRDLQATLLHQLGMDPYKFSYRYQGLNQRLIGPTDEGEIRTELLA